MGEWDCSKGREMWESGTVARGGKCGRVGL